MGTAGWWQCGRYSWRCDFRSVSYSMGQDDSPVCANTQSSKQDFYLVHLPDIYTKILCFLSTQLLAIPFLVGVLNLPPPWAFLMLLPAYLIGEMWIGVCYATVLDQVPHRLVSSAVVLWLFINNNIAGGITLLVPVVERYVGLRYSLLILFPGCYLTATVLFSATLLTLCCRAAWKSHKRGPETKLLISESNSKSCNENYLSKTSQYTSINHDQK